MQLLENRSYAFKLLGPGYHAHRGILQVLKLVNEQTR